MAAQCPPCRPPAEGYTTSNLSQPVLLIALPGSQTGSSQAAFSRKRTRLFPFAISFHLKMILDFTLFFFFPVPRLSSPFLCVAPWKQVEVKTRIECLGNQKIWKFLLPVWPRLPRACPGLASASAVWPGTTRAKVCGFIPRGGGGILSQPLRALVLAAGATMGKLTSRVPPADSELKRQSLKH